MSTRKGAIPSAWDDDDWEAQADVRNYSAQRRDLEMLIRPQKQAASPPKEEPLVKLSRAERKAKHDEANKQLWDAA